MEVSMTRYVALVDGKPGSYGVIVPDLPGCTSAAATTDEVLRRATEAVRLWAEDALADGEKLPKPRSVEALRTDPEVAAALAEGAALAIVPLVLDSGRPAKANLLLDAGPLAAIDEAAAARGLTTIPTTSPECDQPSLSIFSRAALAKKAERSSSCSTSLFGKVCMASELASNLHR
jgi:predicted RNase H-like HicB family nuclease